MLTLAMRSLLPVAIALAALACADPPEPEPEPEDPGSLCACREIDGVQECCFGHGACVEQEQGPRRCACDPGARGETCSTPAPGLHPVRPRSCTGDDPGCVQAFDHVVVASFDTCTDLAGQSFESIIVRPALDAGGDWPNASTFPLVTLTHGASQDPGDYYDLLEHLAANGMIAAAFDATAGEDVTFRANRTLSYLQCLREQWPEADRLDPAHALIGHSRGGAAVALAANAIAEGLATPGGELEAVLALAPSQAGQFSLPAAATPAYFTLQGARDPDTQGASLGWYDLAGAGDPSLIRGLTWVHGATHQRFHQGLLFAGSGELQASLDAEGHWTVARAYLGGFLLWRLLGRDDYRPYFSGEAVPPSVAASWEGPPGVFAGLGDGSEGRLLIHDFDGDALSPTTIPGGTVTTVGFVAAQLDELATLDAPWSGAHRDRGLRLDWSPGPGAALVIALPAPTDLSGYAVLGLRLARTFDAPADCGPPGSAASIHLALRDAATTVDVALAELGQAGRIEAPDRLVPETFGNWVDPDCHAQDSLRPIRIPLARFCQDGLELSAITTIELRVTGEVAGGLLIDDLLVERGEGEAAGCG